MRARVVGALALVVGCGASSGGSDGGTGDAGSDAPSSADAGSDASGALPAWRGNEPTGLTKITETFFQHANEDGWTDSYATSYVTDPTSPSGFTTVGELDWHTGDGEDAPGIWERDLGGSHRRIYLCYWYKRDPSWYGHPSGTNKIALFNVNGAWAALTVDTAIADGPMTKPFGLQNPAGITVNGVSDVSWWLDPNVVAGAGITRGEWHLDEVFLELNTAGNADGRVRWWLDGVLVGDYGSIVFDGAGATSSLFHFYPIWGGNSGATVPHDQYFRLARAYLSGD